MSHNDCTIGVKFRCEYEQAIYEMLLDAEGEGDVRSPTGAWFQSVDLDVEDEAQAAIAEHYGVRFLIALQLVDGTFAVEGYEREGHRHVRLIQLRTMTTEGWMER